MRGRGNTLFITMEIELKCSLPVSCWDEQNKSWVSIKAEEDFKFYVKTSPDVLEFTIFQKDPNICISFERLVEKQIIKALNKALPERLPMDVSANILWSSINNKIIGKIKN
jgi:hypothetical protein